MPTKKKKETCTKTANKRVRKYPWRKNPKKWTDTMFEKRLLECPHLMTDSELGDALGEYNYWRMGTDKYSCKEEEFKNLAEPQPPFSPTILMFLLAEITARLKISGDLSLGRFKNS